jgi:hypothetical protein
MARVEAHAAFAYSELREMKRNVNQNKNGSKRRKLNVEARWLNSDEGLRLAEEAEAVRAVEEKKKQEVREQRVAKEVEREVLRQQRDPNEPFTGTLGPKSKPDLQDVAQALGLETDGQKKALLARINTHFDKNPHLREAPRFEGLFNRSRRRLAAHNNTEGASSSTAPLPTPSYFAPTLHTRNIFNSMSESSLPPLWPSPVHYCPPNNP